MGDVEARAGFADVVEVDARRVRRALIARYGVEVGREVAAEMVAWAWEHRAEVLAADNRAGLLYRVAQSRARAHHRWLDRRAPIELLPERQVDAQGPELVDLFRCLARLSVRERVAVVLVHAHGERYADAARVLGVSEAAVTNHVHRGLRRLRAMLEERP